MAKAESSHRNFHCDAQPDESPAYRFPGHFLSQRSLGTDADSLILQDLGDQQSFNDQLLVGKEVLAREPDPLSARYRGTRDRAARLLTNKMFSTKLNRDTVHPPSLLPTCDPRVMSWPRRP